MGASGPSLAPVALDPARFISSASSMSAMAEEKKGRGLRDDPPVEFLYFSAPESGSGGLLGTFAPLPPRNEPVYKRAASLVWRAATGRFGSEFFLSLASATSSLARVADSEAQALSVEFSRTELPHMSIDVGQYRFELSALAAEAIASVALNSTDFQGHRGLIVDQPDEVAAQIAATRAVAAMDYEATLRDLERVTEEFIVSSEALAVSEDCVRTVERVALAPTQRGYSIHTPVDVAAASVVRDLMLGECRRIVRVLAEEKVARKNELFACIVRRIGLCGRTGSTYEVATSDVRRWADERFSSATRAGAQDSMEYAAAVALAGLAEEGVKTARATAAERVRHVSAMLRKMANSLRDAVKQCNDVALSMGRESDSAMNMLRGFEYEAVQVNSVMRSYLGTLVATGSRALSHARDTGGVPHETVAAKLQAATARYVGTFYDFADAVRQATGAIAGLAIGVHGGAGGSGGAWTVVRPLDDN
jgi:hypothetical protein